MSKLQTVLIMAGGTGGHIFPALAVANQLKAKGLKVEWLGTPKRMEAKIIPQHQIPIHFVSISALRGKGIFSLLLAPFRLMRAISQAKKIIKKVKPDVILGMGGFASGPGGIAAWRLKIPLVIHEQNSVPGLTNKILAKFSQKVLQGFPHVFAEKYHSEFVGNPVRQEFFQQIKPSDKTFCKEQKLHVLVLGGSQGAKAINEELPPILKNLSKEISLQIWHQTGQQHLTKTLSNYQQLKQIAQIEPFIEDMASAYAWADVVIARAGALTIAEITAVGVASILIPYPHAVDDHQTKNAEFLVHNDASVLFKQENLIPSEIQSLLKDLYHHPEKIQHIAQNAYDLRMNQAALQVATQCMEVCRG